MNHVLAEILETGYTTDGAGKSVHVHSHISPDEGEFLGKTLTEVNAEISIEVGLALGVSALYICDALRKTERTRHYVIDPFQQSAFDGIGMVNLTRAGYAGIVRLIEKPSHLALAMLELEGVRADFAFIDGMHTFDHALVDFFHVDRLLNTGGVVVLDDVDHYPSLQRLCSFILNNHAYKVVGDYTERAAPPTWKRRMLDKAVQSAAKVESLRRYLMQNTRENGIPPSRYVAFRKEAEDTRDFKHFVAF